MVVISNWFILEPNIFVRNVFMREWHIILLGGISTLYFLILFYSFLKILSRPYGIIISEEYFIDNSRYEAVGKVSWYEISKIKRIKKTSIQIFFKKNLSKNVSSNLLKKFLLVMQNWDYKNSIVISSALLECDINYLEEKFVKAYKKKQHASWSL
jgi:hypothetical protein